MATRSPRLLVLEGLEVLEVVLERKLRPEISKRNAGQIPKDFFNRSGTALDQHQMLKFLVDVQKDKNRPFKDRNILQYAQAVLNARNDASHSGIETTVQADLALLNTQLLLDCFGASESAASIENLRRQLNTLGTKATSAPSEPTTLEGKRSQTHQRPAPSSAPDRPPHAADLPRPRSGEISSQRQMAPEPKPNSANTSSTSGARGLPAAGPVQNPTQEKLQYSVAESMATGSKVARQADQSRKAPELNVPYQVKGVKSGRQSDVDWSLVSLIGVSGLLLAGIGYIWFYNWKNAREVDLLRTQEVTAPGLHLKLHIPSVFARNPMPNAVGWGEPTAAWSMPGEPSTVISASVSEEKIRNLEAKAREEVAADAVAECCKANEIALTVDKFGVLREYRQTANGQTRHILVRMIRMKDGRRAKATFVALDADFSKYSEIAQMAVGSIESTNATSR